MFAVPAGGTYSPHQTLLLDLSGPLSGEGKGTWRWDEERGRDIGKRRGLNPSEKIPEGTRGHCMITHGQCLITRPTKLSGCG